ncbi:unnamed protein product, partial [Laminaria digitata]
HRVPDAGEDGNPRVHPPGELAVHNGVRPGRRRVLFRGADPARLHPPGAEGAAHVRTPASVLGGRAGRADRHPRAQAAGRGVSLRVPGDGEEPLRWIVPRDVPQVQEAAEDGAAQTIRVRVPGGLPLSPPRRASQHGKRRQNAEEPQDVIASRER